MRHSSFRTRDGVEIAVQEWGNPDGPEVVLIHGFSQCHLSWSAQTTGILAKEFRIVTYDLRGHGASGKPRGAEFYREGDRWADELTGLLDHMALKCPVIVAWSYAGRVIADYLQAYGSKRLAGVNLVGSKTRSDPAFVGTENAAYQALMASKDIAENIKGSISFLRTCAHRWAPGDFEQHLAFNMLVPSEIRGFMLGRSFDADEIYRTLDIPLLFTHGRRDRVAPIAAALYGHALAPHSKLSIYEDVGHAPFLEAPERFNGELATFIRSARRT